MTVPPAALADLNVEQPGFYLRDDYFEILAWLRENSPVHRSANGMVLVTGYEEIREISREPLRYTSRRGAIVNDPLRMSEPNDEAGSLLHLDPPIHADYRKLLNREFTPRAVAKMEETVRKIVLEAFDALPATGVVDLVEQLTLPIPVKVIAELLGMGDQAMVDVRRWSDATIAVSDHQTEEVLMAVMDFMMFLDGHVQSRFDAAAEGRQDDLLMLLAASTVGDAPLTPPQVQMFCMTLMVAGNETTRSLLSGAALALAEHPDQRAALAAALAGDDADRADAALGAAVEECLRWVTPIQAFCRTVVEDLELGGTALSAGEYLVLLYAGGNRDEKVFGATADAFDITRAATPAHLAFGFGEHLCLGASLARMEARMVLEELLRRYPDYEVAGEPVYVASTLTRSLESLPIRLA